MEIGMRRSWQRYTTVFKTCLNYIKCLTGGYSTKQLITDLGDYTFDIKEKQAPIGWVRTII